MRSSLRHVTDDDIEEAVQHDLAIRREQWAEQGTISTATTTRMMICASASRESMRLGVKKKLAA